MSFTITRDDGATDWVAIVKAVFEGLSQWAWPIVVIVFLMLFRAHIGRLLDRVRRAAVGDAGLDFAEGVARASILAEVSQATVTGPVLAAAEKALAEERTSAPADMIEVTKGVFSVGPAKSRIVRGLSTPAQAVIDDFERLAQALTNMAKVLEPGSAPSGRSAETVLAEHHALNPTTALLIDELGRLYSSVALGADVTADEAREFQKNCSSALIDVMSTSAWGDAVRAVRGPAPAI